MGECPCVFCFGLSVFVHDGLFNVLKLIKVKFFFVLDFLGIGGEN
jgi:hypothetical protein